MNNAILKYFIVDIKFFRQDFLEEKKSGAIKVVVLRESKKIAKVSQIILFKEQVMFFESGMDRESES